MSADTDRTVRRHVDVAVLSVAEDTRDARFHRVIEALDAAGLTTGAAGIGDPRDLPTTALATMPTRSDPTRRIPLALRLAWRTDATAVMTLDPAMAIAAWIVTRWRRQHLVVDVHEDYRAVISDRRWARNLRTNVARAAVAGATWVARHADLTVVADDHVPPTRAKRRLVVRNIPPPESMPRPAPRGPEPRAVYIGSLSASRGLDMMLDVLANAPQWHLDLVGSLGDRDESHLHGQMADLGIEDRVTWHGRLAPGRAWEVARGAWLGLALLAPTPAYRAAMPTKLYEYAMVGLPVLATDLPRMRQFVTGQDVGVIVADADEAARRLREWGQEPASLDRHTAAAATWRRSTEAASPFRALGRAVADLVASN
ncbi:MAG TPA: glycosyltransferase [Nitriliruptoraceae bacterium]|nr:glycosyltransferase [Nitriliruptoraceae bacterium]